MGFVKNMIDHDLSLLQMLDGQYIIYRPKIGSPRVIDGMLEEKAIFIPGGHVEIVTNQTILSVRTIDSVDMQVGEKISVDSQAYEIAIIRVNNEGITELVLEKL